MSASETAWQAGTTAWPDLAVTREQLTAFAGALEATALDRFAADIYLAAACLAGVSGAHTAFERELFGAARQAIAAIDGSPAFVDEALQRLRESLFVGAPAKLAGYAARGPLRAWVGVAAARTALMMRRSQSRAKEVLTDDDWSGALAGISTNNPELELLKRQYKDAFGAAFRDGIAALESRLRTVLQMSFVDGLTIDEIGAVYAVHRATAARWIQRASDELHDAVRARLIERLALTPSELDQVAALVRSQLDVSLSQLGGGT
ncbi:MAG: transcriptional regulator [Deltaproteobacteria bacterium]|nr:transcriptional regulator [Deltaproteobacteria bacterium]